MSVSDKGVPGPCADCAADEVCEPIDGRNLCNDCWHLARYKKPPWEVRRVDSPETLASIRAQVPGYTHFTVGGGAYLEDEAKAFAIEMMRRHPKEVYEAVPCTAWWGDRIAHPGYMNKRYRAILAEHPESKA